ncbi:phage integrase family protein [Pseudoroseicyclus aestuarii]|uniref:Phage integrase family protein n=2 Tax=Pseudoroseicyclus aestuarii TaxID=1795041 RepID=A0A318SMF7_9RHOB|nr:phage integrase family protein [Pseudoroseicyclus aestuarii]
MWPATTLADARKTRDRWASGLAAGLDPITARDAQREAERIQRDRTDPVFSEAVDLVFESLRHTLRGDGQRGRWRSPLETHMLPVFGRKPGSQIDQHDIYRALKPIWRTKHAVAIKAWRRTRIVFRQMKLMGFPYEPFAVEAAKHMLGEVIYKPTPMPSTPWQEIPALYAKLDTGNSSDLCLRWMLLTLVRLDGCAGARATEIKDGVWTVPADRIKGREGKVEPFRVPLTAAADLILEEANRFGGDLLFPGQRGRPIGSRALELRLNKLAEPGRPHGFRSSFRTWAQDHDISWEVAETVLGHKVGHAVERAYARSDLLERRKPVMEAWSQFVTGEKSTRALQFA